MSRQSRTNTGKKEEVRQRVPRDAPLVGTFFVLGEGRSFVAANAFQKVVAAGVMFPKNRRFMTANIQEIWESSHNFQNRVKGYHRKGAFS